jgi:glycosyltransferase involved in cell wall biosynthesis
VNQSVEKMQLQRPDAATSTVQAPPRLSLLLWSPNGAGTHYNGPGMSAYRLLAKLETSDAVAVTLAHGSGNQERYELFADQQLISPVSGSIASQAQFIWRGSRWLKRHAGRFDIFYGLQAFDFTVTPAQVAERLGIPAIVKVVQHRSDLADRIGWRAVLGRAAARRRKVERLSGIVAISDAIFEELTGYGIPERKIARIPNGVDTDRFHPPSNVEAQRQARTALGWADEPTIIFAGAIIPRKRPHVLVEALAQLRSSGIPAQLVLAGPVKDKAYAAQMRRLAEDAGVGDKVIWTDFLSDLAPVYRAADLFALLSANEGMPNALLEAMASGLPSVVTPIPGCSDLVRDGEEGTLVEPTARAVAGALRTYLRDSNLRHAHGAAARSRSTELFGARRVLERHLRMYARVLEGKDAAE